MKGHPMPNIQIFDPALCCSTGVWAPLKTPVLP
ncbi:TPA: arsenic metallochaperone ArsD family protein [Pseudomonas aeruginosa]|uniref:Arsenic metallochaperone ArsD family protein n=2 Tax=Pseudomonadota TaxID=1224 RepID=A0A844NF16_PSEAI|nr:arsenic metallochaperone ArsD family protein [Pseudomonas aeruginosa]EKU8099400.1 arsenic metallochaperone ArsD family protein [Klebsiella pneumoniae]EKW7746837.1 arsenic metallochaperone ArsD family protein [Morganella morganii]MCW3505318.1 arsenic metallochaperone ArsD family protein [Burkholderia cenocepacia]QXR35060.1 arsenic metallochaperone ArsD family protein [Alcaligenes aquatilis]HBV7025764.1 arsenic metallochaperone ArsD family protein [Escherichia coli]